MGRRYAVTVRPLPAVPGPVDERPLGRNGHPRPATSRRAAATRASWPLPAAGCPPPAARCPLPAARCPLPAARCPLPAAEDCQIPHHSGPNLERILTLPATARAGGGGADRHGAGGRRRSAARRRASAPRATCRGPVLSPPPLRGPAVRGGCTRSCGRRRPPPRG